MKEFLIFLGICAILYNIEPCRYKNEQKPIPIDSSRIQLEQHIDPPDSIIYLIGDSFDHNKEID